MYVSVNVSACRRISVDVLAGKRVSVNDVSAGRRVSVNDVSAGRHVSVNVSPVDV